jgi:hypothetical protein
MKAFLLSVLVRGLELKEKVYVFVPNAVKAVPFREPQGFMPLSPVGPMRGAVPKPGFGGFGGLG